MPTLHHEIVVHRAPEAVWDAARDVGALHTRLVPGFVVSTEMLADIDTPTRRVTFATGAVLDERIVTIDDTRRRLVWSIASVEHHNGALQVFDDEGGARVVWIADVLPAPLAEQFSPLMARGLQAMKAHLEGRPAPP